MLSLLVTVVLAASVATAPAPPESAADYLADLSAFFKTMDEKYPFFDAKKIRSDWEKTKKTLAKRAARCQSDSEFMGIVVDAMRCLRDGHMKFVKRRVDPPSSEPELFAGLRLLPGIKGTVVVMSSEKNLAQALPPGTIITKIDGKSARKTLDRRAAELWKRGGGFSSPQRASFMEYRYALSGKRGAKHRLHYRDGRKQRSIELICNRELGRWDVNYHLPDGLTVVGKSMLYGSLPGDIGYLWIKKMDDSVERGIRDAIAASPNAKGWIVDLRANLGGGYASSTKTLLRELKRPVAGIIDSGTVSAGETFARDLVNQCGAKLYGQRTAGASSTKDEFTFPSGLATIRYSVGTRGSYDGTPIEYNGVKPHVELEPDPRVLAQGKNYEIEYVRAMLIKGK